jgi:hypothetical protein
MLPAELDFEGPPDDVYYGQVYDLAFIRRTGPMSRTDRE